jgi:hypothetical protein
MIGYYRYVIQRLYRLLFLYTLMHTNFVPAIHMLKCSKVKLTNVCQAYLLPGMDQRRQASRVEHKFLIAIEYRQ